MNLAFRFGALPLFVLVSAVACGGDPNAGSGADPSDGPGIAVTTTGDTGGVPLCNGTDDDTAAIQAAIDAHQAGKVKSPGSLELPMGTCIVSGPIHVRGVINPPPGQTDGGAGAFSIRGKGPGTVVRLVPSKGKAMDASMGVFMVSGTSVTISDLAIVASPEWTTPPTTWAIRQALTQKSDMILPNRYERLNIARFGKSSAAIPVAADGGGIYTEWGHFKIVDNVFVATATAIYHALGSNAGALIAGNTIISNHGIYVGQDSTGDAAPYLHGHHAEGFIVQSNHIATMQGTAVMLDGGLQIRVDQNMIGPVGAHGIYLAATHGSLAFVHITDNWVTGATTGTSTGLAVEMHAASTFPVANVTMRGNTFPRGAAVLVESADTCPSVGPCQTRFTVTENHFVSDAPTAPALRIHDSSYGIVTGNIFSVQPGKPQGGAIEQKGAREIRVGLNIFQNTVNDPVIAAGQDNAPADW